MKKLLSLLLIVISMSGLTACDHTPTQFTSRVYCTYLGFYSSYTYKNYPCYGCDYWFTPEQFSVAADHDPITTVDISNAYSVTCTVIDTNTRYTPHIHYCITWVKGNDD